MAGLEAPCQLMKSSPEKGRREGIGRGAGGARVAARGRGSRREGSGVAASLCAVVCACLLFVCERRQQAGRRMERKEKTKEKRKNINFFLNLIFLKNKR
jgi:hypothetical protein